MYQVSAGVETCGAVDCGGGRREEGGGSADGERQVCLSMANRIAPSFPRAYLLLLLLLLLLIESRNFLWEAPCHDSAILLISFEETDQHGTNCTEGKGVSRSTKYIDECYYLWGDQGLSKDR